MHETPGKRPVSGAKMGVILTPFLSGIEFIRFIKLKILLFHSQSCRTVGMVFCDCQVLDSRKDREIARSGSVLLAGWYGLPVGW